MKRLLLFTLTFLLITPIFCTPLYAAPKTPNKTINDVVAFQDKNFEQAVKKYLNITDRDVLMKDVIHVEYLHLEDSSIASLNDIEYFKNLKHLVAANNQIKNLEPLTKLTKLKGLSLSENPITDLKPLAKLTKLTGLDLSGTHITDLKPLVGMTNLESLDLSNNQIADLKPLAKMAKIKLLNLSHNKISNINILSRFKQSVFLNLSNNKIVDVKALTRLKRVCELDLSNNLITNIEPLSHLTWNYAKNNLRVRGNQIPLNDIIAFEKVMSYYSITDIVLQDLGTRDMAIKIKDKDEAQKIVESYINSLSEVSRWGDKTTCQFENDLFFVFKCNNNPEPYALANEALSLCVEKHTGDIYILEGEQYLPVQKANEVSSAQPAKVTEVQVDNMNDLIKAIGPHKKIVLKPGEYHVGSQFNTAFCSRDMTIRLVDDLTITTNGKGIAHIIQDNPADTVLKFLYAQNVTLEGIKAGHAAPPAGYNCDGAVFYIDRSSNITVKSCNLYGCGKLGIELKNVDGFRLENSSIHDCKQGIMWIYASKNTIFENSHFHDNSGGFLLYNSENIQFTSCNIKNNSQEYEKSSLFEVDNTTNLKLKNCTVSGNKAGSFVPNKDMLILEVTSIDNNEFANGVYSEQ